MADRIVVMNGGRVEQEGTAKDLYERPATLFVANFIGSPPINLFEGVGAGGGIRVRDVTLPLLPSTSGDLVIGIRPESIRANGAGLQGRITAVEPMGREVLYTADGALGTIRFVEAGAEARLREGDDVALSYALRDVLLFDRSSGRRLEPRNAR
jgi:inositol-phosphate transport system ATP-binding protein